MKQRVEKILDKDKVFCTISTFHSFCLRTLRQEAVNLGYSHDFSVCDSVDSLSVVKSILKTSGKGKLERYAPKKVQAVFSKLKNGSGTVDLNTDYGQTISAMFDKYNEILKEQNLMDFDDLLINCVRLLKEFPSIREYYQDKYKFILVDEFQDTNKVQYDLIKLLSSNQGHLTVVGDEDQSIYGWRGANFENILDFPKYFNPSKTIKLEENYRSTKQVLDIANAIIKNNKMRNDKVLKANIKDKGKAVVHESWTPSLEAEFIAKEVQLLRNTIPLNEIVVLYRANYISRNIEDALRKYNIPYKIVGGYKFYERKEVKDILGYLKVINNPADNTSVKRIINIPKRKIGPATIQRLEEINSELFTSMQQLPDKFTKKKEIESFAAVIVKFRERKVFDADFVADLIDEIQYMEMIKLEFEPLEANSRIENLNELINVVKNFKNENPDGKLNDFLDTVSLVADTDEIETKDTVNLMTIHCAKGLEFHSVFLAGMEEGTFPSEKSSNTDKELEEERRLMYVAVTRAKHNLYFTFSRERGWGWQTIRKKASRFFAEIPDELLDLVNSGKGGLYTSILKASSSKKISDTKKSESTETFGKGSVVKHHIYGEGTVLNLVDSQKLVIKFKRHGIKMLQSSVVEKIE
jgi:DNA helicase-2/ATP-dependent DNA helicase PcrA